METTRNESDNTCSMEDIFQWLFADEPTTQHAEPITPPPLKPETQPPMPVVSWNDIPAQFDNEISDEEEDLVSRIIDDHNREDVSSTPNGEIDIDDYLEYVLNSLASLSINDADDQPQEVQCERPHVTINNRVAVISSDHVTFEEMPNHNVPQGDIRLPSDITPNCSDTDLFIDDLDDFYDGLTEEDNALHTAPLDCASVSDEDLMAATQVDQPVKNTASSDSNKKLGLLQMVHNLAILVQELTAEIHELVASHSNSLLSVYGSDTSFDNDCYSTEISDDSSVSPSGGATYKSDCDQDDTGFDSNDSCSC